MENKKLDFILVSEKGYKSDDIYDLIWSNISVLNLLRDLNVGSHQLQRDALISYYIDYYLSQVKNGGFAQFVYNAWDPELVDLILDGLKRIEADQHALFLKAQIEKVQALEEDEFKAFMKGNLFGENALRDLLNSDNDAFYAIEEDLIQLNGQWLKAHPKLKVLPIEKMYEEIEAFVGKSISRRR